MLEIVFPTLQEIQFSFLYFLINKKEYYSTYEVLFQAKIIFSYSPQPATLRKVIQYIYRIENELIDKNINNQYKRMISLISFTISV